MPVVAVYMVMTVSRNGDWKNDHTLCAADAPKAPNDTWIQYFAGLQLQKEYEAEADSVVRLQLSEKSIQHFKRSLEIYPENSEAHADLGVAYTHAGNTTAAELHFERAIALNPVHMNAITNLATLYYIEGDFANAIGYYERAIALQPTTNLVNYYYNMGICNGRLNQGERAIYCFKKVVEMAPEFDGYKSYGNIAILYEMAGEMDSARKYEVVTKRYFPEFHLKN